MKNKLVDRSKKYTSFEDFFMLNGSGIMKVSASAGIDICQECTKRSIYIWKIEGGIWHNSKFEARIDCIWDSLFSENNTKNPTIRDNNQLAEKFIKEEMDIHNAFIITVYKGQ